MKKIMFIIQGEGRGHMTQAISLKQLLEKNGFRICAAMVGSSSNREIPEFFTRSMDTTPVIPFRSPNFVTKNDRGIRILPTITRNLGMLRRFLRSVDAINAQVEKDKPELIINFYDPLAGLFNYFKKPKVPTISIAHQYLAFHPDFPFPKGYAGDRFALEKYTQLTSFGSQQKLALSFYETGDIDKKNLRIVPPLLRRDVFELQPETGDYFLVYLVNKGYRDDILAWHKLNPEVKLHCFTDDTSIEDVHEVDATLSFHRLNDKKFLSLMAGARGLISTAGFESICEALYLGKPVFMVPVEGHFEQLCNSRDAFNAGAGIFDTGFNIDRFLDYLPSYRSNAERFKAWVNEAEARFTGIVRQVIAESAGDY